MKPPGTPLRNIRVDDDRWTAALVQAAKEGTDVSARIRQFLAEWTAEPGERARHDGLKAYQYLTRACAQHSIKYRCALKDNPYSAALEALEEHLKGMGVSEETLLMITDEQE